MAGDGWRWWHSACTHHGYTMARLLSMALLTMAIRTMAVLTAALLTMALLTIALLTMALLTMAGAGDGGAVLAQGASRAGSETHGAYTIPTLYRHYTDTILTRA